MEHLKVLQDEIKGSVDFFLHFTNFDKNSRGFGLTVDSTKNPNLSSIASVGYALTAWVIAAERGYIIPETARDITRRTLTTLCCHASHHRGFFAHFLKMDTAERYRNCEYSTIDTAICLCGVVTAAAYFDDPEIRQMARDLLGRVDWNFFVFERDGKALFRMAYNPDRNGDYVSDQPGFIASWDMSAEQKMMYLLASEHVEPDLARRLYQGFTRDFGIFEGQEFIVSPNGSLYIYHCSEAWLDTARYIDPAGVDWFQNGRLFALANRGFCVAHSNHYKTYHANSWGLSSGDSPTGYAVFGGTPCRDIPRHNGTVSIWGALASLPFIPEQTLDLVDYLVRSHPQAWGPYGFYDAYNLDVTPPWYSQAIYGIDKGCSMIMIENYLSGLIWDVFTNSATIQNALAILGFRRREGVLNGPVFDGRRSILTE